MGERFPHDLIVSPTASTSDMNDGPSFRILFSLPQYFVSNRCGITLTEGNVFQQVR